MAEKSDILTRWEELRPSKQFVFVACVLSVALTALIGFKWGGWVTGSTAQEMAARAASKARVELAVDYCVYRFNHSAKADAVVTKLKDISSWMRGDHLEKVGWVTPVGVEEPVEGAGDRCAERILSPKTANP
ncbi:MAG: hypothetical protein R3229_03895 [Alphaproteobacteria bacterium]|nr:hypothetical protein [Alphaproteobacteria bacterium]